MPMAKEIIIAALQSSQMFIDHCRNIFFVSIYTVIIFIGQVRKKTVQYEQLFEDDDEYIALNEIKEAPIRMHLYIENVVMQYNSRQFQEHFRMSSETFSTTLALTAPLLSNQYGTGRPTYHKSSKIIFISVVAIGDT